MPIDNLISRRSMVAGLASTALAMRSGTAETRGTSLVYVGTYSSPQGPEGSKGNGQGIYLFEMDRATGKLNQREVFDGPDNPSWLALHPSGHFLYAANEVGKPGINNSGSVSAFAVDRSSGNLTRLNTVSSEGAGPTHLALHPSGKYVFVANYAGGTFTVLPVQADGQLGEATHVEHEAGNTGPARAASAPTGSFAISGHDRPHAHMIQPDPSGNFVLGCDLGLDLIRVWKFDAQTGKLSPADAPFVSVDPGDGPRHLAFHPNGKWLYSLQEEGSTVVFWGYDKSTGKLDAQQRLSTLPLGFNGTNFTSEIRVSPDARFLYVGNRLHDTIAAFVISANGSLRWASETSTEGDYPRSFTLDPTGSYLYCCNQRSDAITSFRVNRGTGGLTFTGNYTAVGTPSIVLFLT